MKGFVTSGDTDERVLAMLGSGEVGRVLGVGWDPRKDVFTVQIRINLSKRVRGVRKEKDLTDEQIENIHTEKLTKQMCMGVTNSCYDPYGLLAAICVQPKIELRELYRERDRKWTDDIPRINKIVWRSILRLLKKCQGITFRRCINNPDCWTSTTDRIRRWFPKCYVCCSIHKVESKGWWCRRLSCVCENTCHAIRKNDCSKGRNASSGNRSASQQDNP